MSAMQNFVQRYVEIWKYHGVVRGTRRVIDQFFQIDLYDYGHSTNTRFILSGQDFISALGGAQAPSAMHYQPVYTSAVRKPLLHLVKNFPIVGASSCCFLDLGCGRGKALHVAKSTMQHITVIGVDLHPELIRDAAANLGVEASVGGAEDSTYLVDTPKAKLVCNNVNDVAYDALLASFDVVIVFNKNSFDRKTTVDSLEKIKQGCVGKSLFYVYNNPVFGEDFAKYDCVFSMSGWHKNWNTNVYRIV